MSKSKFIKLQDISCHNSPLTCQNYCIPTSAIIETTVNSVTRVYLPLPCQTAMAWWESIIMHADNLQENAC